MRPVSNEESRCAGIKGENLGCPLTIRIASIVACAGLALLAHASEGAAEISPNIANARWEDCKETYPICALCEVDEITLWTCDDDELFPLLFDRDHRGHWIHAISCGG